MEYLSRFNYVWQYRPGRLNVADPVSRRPHGLPVAAMTRAHVHGAGEVNPAPVAVTVFQQRIQEGYGKDPWYAGDNTRMLCKQHDLWWRGNAIAVPDHGSLRDESSQGISQCPLQWPYRCESDGSDPAEELLVAPLQRGCSQSCATL